MFLTKTITVMLVIIALILIKSTWMWCAAMLSSIMPKPMWRWPLLRTLYGLVQQRMSFRPTMGDIISQPSTSVATFRPDPSVLAHFEERLVVPQTAAVRGHDYKR